MTPKYGHDPIAQYLHELSLNGADDELGDIGEYGFFICIFRGFDETDFTPQAEKLLGPERIQTLKESVGAIVAECEHGFVEAHVYEEKEDLEAAWKAWENEVEEVDQIIIENAEKEAWGNPG